MFDAIRSKRRRKRPNKPTAKKPKRGSAYEREKNRSRTTQAQKSLQGRDIAPLPKVVNPERKGRCKGNLEAFLREYLPGTFQLAWSADHRTAIDKIQQAVMTGGLFAYAMPRGSGKTSMIVGALLWALLYGHRRFVTIIASDNPEATSILTAAKSELECNDLLFGDFPEACYPVRMLDGIAQRSNGQLYNQKRTHIKWSEREIVLANVPGSECSAGIVRVAGITGRIRGMRFTRPDRTTVRPDLAIIEDPQTDESARSPGQVDAREKVVKGAILGLAGPGKQIAGFMTCTVIEPDDLADRILDRQKHPQWNGQRTKLLYGWPERDDLWEQYARVRADAMRAGDDKAIVATELYQSNREAMDAGATAAWAVRHYPHEASALQHAMNLYFDLGKRAFSAEYQNEPLPAETSTQHTLTPDEIARKANGKPRGIIPQETTHLVAMVDVQKELLFLTVLALRDDFTGHVVDYATYPDQRREYFRKSDVKRTLMKAENASRFEESLRKGLETTTSQLLGREWKRDDGGIQKIELCLIDAHWGESTQIIKTFCRESRYAGIVMPSYGIGISAKQNPFNDRPKKPGEKRGTFWRQPRPESGAVRHVLFDANAVKTFCAERFRQDGGPGSFSIFGDAQDHQMFADHMTSEFPTLTSGRGRTITEWTLTAGRDNDWLDTVVGCCVAGSVQGVSLTETPDEKPKVLARVKFSELQKKGSTNG